MTKANATDCTVRYYGSSHITNTVQGLRGSSTINYSTAAEVLGGKLYGVAFVRAEDLGPVRAEGPQHLAPRAFRLHADDTLLAYAWESGRIDFGVECPEGACAFAKGPDRALRAVVDVLSRHGQGKGDGVLLVPGVPEAQGGNARMDALLAWQKWAADGNGRPGRWGVVFGAVAAGA